MLDYGIMLPCHVKTINGGATEKNSLPKNPPACHCYILRERVSLSE